jgi:hypothetical protein
MQFDTKNDVVARAKALIADPRNKELVLRANEALVRCKGVAGSLHNDTTLTNLSIQYKNPSLIGLQLMPVVKVDKLSNKFAKYSQRDRLAVPSDEVTNRSVPNEVSENRSFDNYSCKQYALLNYIDEMELQNQDAPLNEMVDLMAAVNDALALAEEQRIATILTTAANFPTANKVTLSGTDRWSITGAEGSTSDPIRDIQVANRAVWSGFGNTKRIGYCSGSVFDVLKRHSKISDRFKYVQSGLPLRTQIAQMLELDDILVGDAWNDTANIGQAQSNARIWGAYFGVVSVASSPSTRSAHFGSTFRMGDKVSNQWFDPKIGMAGGYYAKVGMAEDHKIVASDAGYLISATVA